jgi:hypothetical protein
LVENPNSGGHEVVIVETGFKILWVSVCESRIPRLTGRADRPFQGLLELFNPSNWTTKVSGDLLLSFLEQRGSDRVVVACRRKVVIPPNPLPMARSRVHVYAVATRT